MAPKEQPSKKAVREKKKSIVEDATFGLKNKNKSKKVQQFISRTELSVKKSHGGSEMLKNKEDKETKKLAKKLQEEELRLLFNEGITGQHGKSKAKAKDSALELGLLEASNEVNDYLDALSSDSDSDTEVKEKRKTLYIDDEPQQVEVFREKTIEDIIDEQRTKLAAEGKTGTPVTAASFATWRAAKLAKKQAEAEERMKLAETKKKGGKDVKGSVLSGKELYNYNASLFIDDDAAIDQKEENKMNAELIQRQEEEDARVQADLERAQAEQDRLAAIQQVEIEARNAKEAARRIQAASSTRATFQLLGVSINQCIFEEDDDEDLASFLEPSNMTFISIGSGVEKLGGDSKNNNGSGETSGGKGSGDVAVS